MQLKIALKELMRMLIRHYNVVEPSLSDSAARFSAAIVRTASEVKVPVTLTFATLVNSEEIEDKAIVALT